MATYMSTLYVGWQAFMFIFIEFNSDCIFTYLGLKTMRHEYRSF